MSPRDITSLEQAQEYLVDERTVFTLFCDIYRSSERLDTKGIVTLSALAGDVYAFVHSPWCEREFSQACASGDVGKVQSSVSQQAVRLGLDIAHFLEVHCLVGKRIEGR